MPLAFDENFLVAVNHNFRYGLILHKGLENIQSPERVIDSANHLPLLSRGQIFDMLIPKHPAFDMLHEFTVTHTRSDIQTRSNLTAKLSEPMFCHSHPPPVAGSAWRPDTSII
ncbi:hypothetical protein D3C71_829840 [compost metagenome]